MDKLTIVKVGGKIVEEEHSLTQLLNDFSTISGNKILVHGGGRSATAIAARLGIESKMVDGRRITDKEMLEVVTMVYGGLVNKQIVAGLQAKGCNASGFCGADMDIIRSVKRPVKEIDYGYVGDVVDVNTSELRLLLEQGVSPVIAPLTHNGKGVLLNTNADTIASELAMALAKYFSVHLIYCFEKNGVLSNPDDDNSVIHYIDPALYQQYKSEGVISEGMIPKLDNAFRALNSGVAEVQITNANNLTRHNARGTVLKLS
ncbi:MAG TPA: acetylglutamate kinase [Prolixibacteraceae bacterium]|nr:acetylglutamate kinase [Prolixibacteraceae bacterium]HPR60412.1 acetylglutamate kinase [Prolixibacteraceae bacterium]